MRSDRLSRGSTLTDSGPSRTSSTDGTLASSALTSCAETPARKDDTDEKDPFREPEIQALEKGILKLSKPVPPPPLESKDSVFKSSCRPSPMGKDGHPHWSTSRENNRLYKTCDGFRRQENEREMHYVFMPKGPIENFLDGQRCALCHINNPDEDHLRQHDVLQFAKSSNTSLKRSRRGEFEKLLRAHKVPDTHIDELVEQWHFIQKKKAYSCGLCIKLLSTLSERTSHMCREHFGKGQNMDNWNDNNLIRGLLLQPELRKCCRSLFDSDPSRADSGFFWPSSVIKELQYKLELGRGAPQELASLAFKAAECKENPSSNQDVAATGSQFSKQILNTATASAVSYPDTVAAMQSATNAVHFPTSVTRCSDAQKEPLPDEDMFDDPCGPLDASALYAQSTSDSNTKFRTRTNSHSFKNSSQVDATLYLSEVPFGLPLSLGDFMNNYSHGGTSTDEEHGTYIPPASYPSSRINTDATPAFDSSPSYDPTTWYVQDQGSSPAYDPNYMSLPSPVPKRKLSENSAAAAHSRPQTMSPMEIRPGIHCAPKKIQEL